MLRADLHLHTNASPDSLITPEALVKRCLKKGINCIAVTDHNTMDGVAAVQHIAPFRVIRRRGDKDERRRNHRLLPARARFRRGLSPEETVRRIKDAGRPGRRAASLRPPASRAAATRRRLSASCRKSTSSRASTPASRSRAPTTPGRRLRRRARPGLQRRQRRAFAPGARHAPTWKWPSSRRRSSSWSRCGRGRSAAGAASPLVHAHQHLGEAASPRFRR